MALASILESVLGTDLPIAVRAYDGSAVGPPDPPATVIVRSPDALRRIITAPGELGLARAYVAGDLDLEGDIFAGLALRDRLPDVKLHAPQILAVARELGWSRTCGRCPRRPKRRACTARGIPWARPSRHLAPLRRLERLLPAVPRTVADVLVRGVHATPTCPSRMRRRASTSSSRRKLDLQPGHAPARRRLRLGRDGHARRRAPRRRRRSASPCRTARSSWRRSGSPKRASPIGCRSATRTTALITDGPFDAISSIGMFEHVGEAGSPSTSAGCTTCCRPGGRLLNHGISRPPDPSARRARGSVATASSTATSSPTASCTRSVGSSRSCSEAGFEVRHVESLREHYAQDAAALGRQPRGPLGRGGRARRPGPRPHLAALHGRLRGQLRGEPAPDPSGARGEARRRPLGHAAAPEVGYTAADTAWVTSRG